MSCRLTAPSVSFLLFLLRVQTIDLSHARSLSPLSDFDLPEIDGSAVEDTCTIFSTGETENKPPLLTPMPPRKPPTKDTGTPIEPQPAPPGPIDNSQSELAARLLTYLYLPYLRNYLFSKPIAGLPQSDSDESALTWFKNTNRNRWQKGLTSSDDSSDES
ncbi:hypothetical protein Q8A73_012773 [Channa argus]|nr:hypothetical protein Q8A73_012773 [Channa argus]